MKDYYKILDLPEYSDFSEVKVAYRKLARKWHPDVAGNSQDVIEKFKEINEAYTVLSDSNRKADYDKARKFYNYTSEPSCKKNSETVNNSTKPNFKSKEHEETKKSAFSFSWDAFVKNNFKASESKKASGNKTAKKGKDINSDIEITLEEAINGTTKIINMLQTHVCNKCGGRKFVNGTVCQHCKGKGSETSYKRFNVKVPAGVKNGSKIRLAGEGEKGMNGGSNGDMYLTVHIKSPLDYTVDGINVYKTLNITPYEAVLGANVHVHTVSEHVTVKIAPNTQNGQKIRLSGCGIKDGNRQGDMIITIAIQVGKNLSEQEIELYKRLRDISESSVR